MKGYLGVVRGELKKSHEFAFWPAPTGHRCSKHTFAMIYEYCFVGVGRVDRRRVFPMLNVRERV